MLSPTFDDVKNVRRDVTATGTLRRLLKMGKSIYYTRIYRRCDGVERCSNCCFALVNCLSMCSFLTRPFDFWGNANVSNDNRTARVSLQMAKRNWYCRRKLPNWRTRAHTAQCLFSRYPLPVSVWHQTKIYRETERERKGQKGKEREREMSYTITHIKINYNLLHKEHRQRRRVRVLCEGKMQCRFFVICM